MKSLIKKRSECTDQDFKEFTRLVAHGGQVSLNGIENTVRKRAHLLGLCYDEEKLVSIVAIKKPSRAYVRKVFDRANISGEARNFGYEIAWGCTLSDYRRRGISGELVTELLEAFRDHNIFATSTAANEATRNILSHHGFQESGTPYEGRKELVQLYTRRVNGEVFDERLFSRLWLSLTRG